MILISILTLSLLANLVLGMLAYGFRQDGKAFEDALKMVEDRADQIRSHESLGRHIVDTSTVLNKILENDLPLLAQVLDSLQKRVFAARQFSDHAEDQFTDRKELEGYRKS